MTPDLIRAGQQALTYVATASPLGIINTVGLGFVSVMSFLTARRAGAAKNAAQTSASQTNGELDKRVALIVRREMKRSAPAIVRKALREVLAEPPESR